MNEDEKYMQRCLELAQMGQEHAAPNPMVGSVIVHHGSIIGEGYHRKCGEAHAEVNAIAAVRNPELLQESTLYVNLEPCAHQGRTPACSLLIKQKRIKRVVIGCVDSFAKVAGKGIEILRSYGCDVQVGVLEKESRELNRRFFTFHEKKRPYVILKWAQTMDGLIDKMRTPDMPIEPIWITNEHARVAVHKMRAEEPAIMIGTNTAIKDNPKLTLRDWSGKHPLRIVLDRLLRIQSTAGILDKSVPTLVFTASENKKDGLLEYVNIDFEQNVLTQVLDELYRRDILSVIIEGGSELLNSFLLQNIWDEARIFVGESFFGNGIAAPRIRKHLINKESYGDSSLFIYRNK